MVDDKLIKKYEAQPKLAKQFKIEFSEMELERFREKLGAISEEEPTDS